MPGSSPGPSVRTSDNTIPSLPSFSQSGYSSFPIGSCRLGVRLRNRWTHGRGGTVIEWHTGVRSERERLGGKKKVFYSYKRHSGKVVFVYQTSHSGRRGSHDPRGRVWLRGHPGTRDVGVSLPLTSPRPLRLVFDSEWSLRPSSDGTSGLGLLPKYPDRFGGEEDSVISRKRQETLVRRVIDVDPCGS